MGSAKDCIESGKAVLGIEFGSTRIKAVLIDEKHTPIASGSHEWENRLENGFWTYSLEDIWDGLRDCYRSLLQDVRSRYGTGIRRLGAIGFSAMMHGYMAFDKEGELLVPFRTWRNGTTGPAAEALTDSSAVEYFPSLSGDSEQGGACKKHCFSDNPGRIYSLEGVRGKGSWYRGCFGNVSY